MASTPCFAQHSVIDQGKNYVSFEEFYKTVDTVRNTQLTRHLIYWQYRQTMAIESQTEQIRKLRLVNEKLLKELGNGQ